jgi:hypothetical protein
LLVRLCSTVVHGLNVVVVVVIDVVDVWSLNDCDPLLCMLGHSREVYSWLSL